MFSTVWTSLHLDIVPIEVTQTTRKVGTSEVLADMLPHNALVGHLEQ